MALMYAPSPSPNAVSIVTGSSAGGSTLMGQSLKYRRT